MDQAIQICRGIGLDASVTNSELKDFFEIAGGMKRHHTIETTIMSGTQYDSITSVGSSLIDVSNIGRTFEQLFIK